jgi:hypothetical protein
MRFARDGFSALELAEKSGKELATLFLSSASYTTMMTTVVAHAHMWPGLVDVTNN